MITLEQYVGRHAGHPDWTDERRSNAEDLLSRVNGLMDLAEIAGIPMECDPDTGTQISGARDGAGDGGFRLQDSATGHPKSAHKEGKGVDPYDKGSKLDDWITEFDEDDGRRNSLLEKFNLYREHPDATRGADRDRDWCHLQTHRPASGKRTFRP